MACILYMPTGAEVLHIEGQFLAMDWRNNPKDSHSVIVTPKQTLVRPPVSTITVPVLNA